MLVQHWSKIFVRLHSVSQAECGIFKQWGRAEERSHLIKTSILHPTPWPMIYASVWNDWVFVSRRQTKTTLHIRLNTYNVCWEKKCTHLFSNNTSIHIWTFTYSMIVFYSCHIQFNRQKHHGHVSIAACLSSSGSQGESVEWLISREWRRQVNNHHIVCPHFTQENN